MSAPPARIAILGGGTAGWMAACLFERAWPQTQVTVIEAPDIPIVGVGEGSTPQLKAFFDRIGVTEAEWMPACDATYKAGIAFRGWSDARSSYFHPFAGPTDLHTEAAFHVSALARRTGADVEADPDRFFLATRIARAGLAPVAPEAFPFGPGYGYHFDAHKVGAFLRGVAIARGVRHLQRRVVEVNVVDDEVAALVLEHGDRVDADVYIDASGFRATIATALGAAFLPFAANLFCDRAVVTPTSADSAPLAQTTATALSAGWTWRIPLTARAGNGYVYASRYCDSDAAAAELRRHLALPEDAPVRHLEMRVGRLATSWTGNCLAIGLAHGFIEPLEATALHLVQATVEGFIDTYPTGERDAFNARIARRYEGVRDYIVAHYRLNGRRDTAFWRDNAAHDHLSDDLKAVITAWFTGRDLPQTIADLGIGGFYAPLSWGCLLAGYGAFPAPERLRPAPPVADLAAIDRLLDRCLLNFRPHADLLAERIQP